MNQNIKLQPVRGTKDLYGNEIKSFNRIVKAAKELSELYGFEEISTPIFEFSEIFERNLGDSSDIISKEVYKFPDRGDNFLTLRPEFTASIVRAFISNGELSQTLPKKLFSYGPLFRYDRPQKGRQRQFHQVNFENIGSKSQITDIETISLANHLLEKLEFSEKSILQINSLGCEATKERYQKILGEYFQRYEKDLSEDSRIRLLKNPLRILDSKNKEDIRISAGAPQINLSYQKETEQKFEQILTGLEKLNIKYQINHNLVRGLDYYTSTVFEFVTSDLGAQNTILAGGRYDNLIAKMGGAEIPAIGFASGIERLMMLGNLEEKNQRVVFVVYVDIKQQEYAFNIVNQLRKSGIATEIIFDANMKKQMKKASNINAKKVVIIGEEELRAGYLNVKDFDSGDEEKVLLKDLVKKL